MSMNLEKKGVLLSPRIRRIENKGWFYYTRENLAVNSL